MAHPSGFATRGFRFNEAYKILVVPSDSVTAISELVLCFPSCGSSSVFKRESYGGKAWVCLTGTTKAEGDLKHRVVTHHCKPNELGGGIMEF